MRPGVELAFSARQELSASKQARARVATELTLCTTFA